MRQVRARDGGEWETVWGGGTGLYVRHCTCVQHAEGGEYKRPKKTAGLLMLHACRRVSSCAGCLGCYWLWPALVTTGMRCADCGVPAGGSMVKP